MPLLARWLVAALVVDMVLAILVTLAGLFFGWSPADPIFALVRMTQ